MPELVQTIFWELRGSFPTDIEYFPEVDIAELTKGDDDPFFLTIPIGEVNAKSGNGRFYDEKWLVELEKQVRQNRPVGIMGHIKPEDSFDFPAEAIHWVGAKRVAEILWGKGYMPPGEARERVRRYKATNTKMGTSIFGEAKGIYDKAVDALRMVAESLKLHQIDIGPANRIGIQSLAAVPMITSEMQDDKENVMDKVQVIREMTVDDADLIPKPVREAVIASVPTPPEVALVTELRAELGDGDLLAVVREMKQARQQQQETAVTSRVTELVGHAETGVKVAELRPIVTELVMARNPETAEAAETVYNEVVTSQPVLEMLKAAVTAKGGPPLRTGLQSQQNGNKYFNIPTKESA